MGVSENRGPLIYTQNVLIIGTPNKVPLIYGNSHLFHFEVERKRWFCGSVARAVARASRLEVSPVSHNVLHNAAVGNLLRV